MRWLAAVLLLCTALRIEARSEQFIVLTKIRPMVLELEITLDGKSYSQAWEVYVDQLFRDLDVDGDGWLSRTEAARAPNVSFVTSFLHGSLNLEAAQAVIPFDQLDVAHQGRVSRLDLGDYYRRMGLNCLRRLAGPEREQTAALTDALFHVLGHGTNRIALDDLKRAGSILRRVDLNDDEWITPEEILLHAPDRPALKRSQPTLENLGLLPLQGAPTRAEWASIRARLPDWNEHRLGPLVSVLAVRLGTRPGHEPAVESLGGKVVGKHLDTGGIRLTVDGMEIDLQIGTGTVSRALGMHAFYRQQFHAADAGRRGFLETKQVEDFPALGALFRLADRDGDGRLTSKEFETFLTLHANGLQSFVTLTASDRSPGLFELLDENGDGRLSLRELHTAWERLGSLPRNKEHALEREDLPRRLELQATRGGPTPRTVTSGQAVMERSTVRGPAWFRRMDRNGDGYVSRREFLGSLEDFKRLDVDGDDLISPQEAEKLDTPPIAAPLHR